MGFTERELCQDSLHTDPRWYAIEAKYQHERRVEVALQSNDFETLVPMYRVRRQWSDRMKEIDRPLFAGYVFCHFAYRQKVRLLNTPGVRRIIGFGGVPAPIPDVEISTIQAILRSKLPVRPWPMLRPGDRVRIEKGPLRGLEGTLLKEKDNLRLVVGVELLRRSIAAEIEPGMIVPMRGLST